MQYTDTGTLIVKTYTAGGALPVENSVIRIFGVDEENGLTEYSLTTDRDGLTERISLPAPPRSISLTPEQTEFPYAQYTVEISADGYYPKIINNLAIFSGTQAFQPVNMIPIAVYERGVDVPKDTLSTTVEENPYL